MTPWAPSSLIDLLEAVQTLAAVLGVIIGYRAYQTWVSQRQAQGQRQEVIVQLPYRLPEEEVAVDEENR